VKTLEGLILYKVLLNSTSITSTMSTAWDSVPVRREVQPPPVAEAEIKEGSQEANVKALANTYDRVPRSSLFGLVLGGTCGAAYGIMESFSSKDGRKAENLRASLLNVRLNSMLFAGGFAVFQAAKETIRVARGTKQTDEYDPYNAVAASVATVGPMMFYPATRRIFPHMLFLIAVDSVNESGIKLY
jgi:hypothetical protein